MIQIALFAIAGMMLAVFVGNMRREIGIWIALVTGVIVFFMRYGNLNTWWTCSVR